MLKRSKWSFRDKTQEVFLWNPKTERFRRLCGYHQAGIRIDHDWNERLRLIRDYVLSEFAAGNNIR